MRDLQTMQCQAQHTWPGRRLGDKKAQNIRPGAVLPKWAGTKTQHQFAYRGRKAAPRAGLYSTRSGRTAEISIRQRGEVWHLPVLRVNSNLQALGCFLALTIIPKTFPREQLTQGNQIAVRFSNSITQLCIFSCLPLRTQVLRNSRTQDLRKSHWLWKQKM